MKNKYRVALLPGDGIGPEIADSAVKAAMCAAEKFGFELEFVKAFIGGAAIDAAGTPLPEETLRICKESDAVLLAAVGGKKWDHLDKSERPEAGLLGIRKGLGLFANLRPAVTRACLVSASPLKSEILKGGIDILTVREICSGIYFGESGEITTSDGEKAAFDTEYYSESQIKRIAKVAFEAARKRSGHVTSIDKANVLRSSVLWRKTVCEVAKNYPDVRLDHMYIDNASMQLVTAPDKFDVILASNMFGDILSDESAALCGSIGMLPSASLAEGSFGLYEPVHGSAPDIAGKGIANPLAQILSVAMMFRYSFSQEEAALALERAVDTAIEHCRTPDIASDKLPVVGTDEMTKAVCTAI